jgi:replicative DNA helicase
LLDKVERDVLLINQARVGATEIRMLPVIQRAQARIEELYDKQGELTGIGSGYPSLDRKTNGFHGGEMIVIAARPSVGKTTFAMNIAEHVALEQNLPVGVFSLEMSAEQLGMRLLCSQARLDLSKVRDGFLRDSDFERLRAASGRLVQAPIYIDETGGLTIMEIRAKARRMKQQYGVALIVIDYLQLCHSESSRIDNRQQEIADISHGIKELAKELNVPVIVLSQMNRDYERDNDKKKRKPRLSDLRESGAIEQDADLVGLLYKPKEDDEGEAEPGRGEGGPVQVNLLIGKHRNGPTGEVRLVFFKAYTRFESASPVFTPIAEANHCQR